MTNVCDRTLALRPGQSACRSQKYGRIAGILAVLAPLSAKLPLLYRTPNFVLAFSSASLRGM